MAENAPHRVDISKENTTNTASSNGFDLLGRMSYNLAVSRQRDAGLSHAESAIKVNDNLKALGDLVTEGKLFRDKFGNISNVDRSNPVNSNKDNPDALRNNLVIGDGVINTGKSTLVRGSLVNTKPGDGNDEVTLGAGVILHGTYIGSGSEVTVDTPNIRIPGTNIIPNNHIAEDPLNRRGKENVDTYFEEHFAAGIAEKVLEASISK